MSDYMLVKQDCLQGRRKTLTSRTHPQQQQRQVRMDQKLLPHQEIVLMVSRSQDVSPDNRTAFSHRLLCRTLILAKAGRTPDYRRC